MKGMKEAMNKFSIQLSKLIADLHLEKIHYLPEMDEVEVSSADVNRPGLQLIGFFDYFDPSRIQIIGKVETTYLSGLSPEDRCRFINPLFSKGIPAVIITRGMEISSEVLESARANNVPLLRTEDVSSRFMSTLISYLNVLLAPRITCHGVLVEVYGEGLLLLGESGVGKSETAIELLKRGHRLVADDAVEVKRVSDKTLVGSAPDVIRHFIELRGIGIINVKNIFGMGAVKETEKIDLVVQLEPWEDNKEYDRLGMDTEYTTLLDVKIPSITIPVRQGRNLAVIMEVAAMNNRQKKMGFNAAQELNARLIKDTSQDEVKPERTEKF